MSISLSALSQSEFSVLLNDGWKFQPAFLPQVKDSAALGRQIKNQWHDVQVPSSALSGLYANGLIEDPFYGANEKKLKWLEEIDWIFEKTFTADDDLLKNSRLELVFHGLDTYADVSLNGKIILKTDNQFRTYEADVKQALQPGANTLRIYFYAPGSKENYKRNAYGMDLPDGTRMFSRKAAYQYGWDWGPRFVSCGISGDVELKAWNDARLTDVFIRQISLTDQLASLQAEFSITADQAAEATVWVMMNGQVVEKKTMLTAGVNLVPLNIQIQNPKRWQTHNLGEPFLYKASASLWVGGKEKGKIEKNIGFRTLELVRDKDKDGETFYFKLNGAPVYAKGANMIPVDFFQEKASNVKIKKLIDDAAAVNMNMLRVWGGGIYQPDYFYDYCDQKGILVWQDFMFACAMYPGDSAFLENVRQEVGQQIVRLRNHPSLALWCGNNEIKEAWNNWGWKQRYDETQQAKIWKDYVALFGGVIPSAIKELSPDVPYHESSPNYSRYNPKNFKEGDSHYWGVWHDVEPFEMYEKKIPRFMSEFGFQSLPQWSTLQSFAPSVETGRASVGTGRDLSLQMLESEAMQAHQKHPLGNKLMKTYMQRYYKTPANFKDFARVSQLLQADGMAVGVEAQRRAKPYCMGSLYWQLNDVWPAISWSGIDYQGNWKALHYRLKDVFSDLLISPVIEKEVFKVYLVSDLPAETAGTLSIQLLDFTGKIIFHEERPILAPANASNVFYESPVSALLQQENPGSVFFYISFIDQNKRAIEKTFYLSAPKNLTLPKGIAERQIAKTDGGYKITLRSPVLLKSVYLQCDAPGFFEENYFDLIPGRSKTIFFQSGALQTEIEKSLKTTSLSDIYP